MSIRHFLTLYIVIKILFDTISCQVVGEVCSDAPSPPWANQTCTVRHDVNPVVDAVGGGTWKLCWASSNTSRLRSDHIMVYHIMVHHLMVRYI